MERRYNFHTNNEKGFGVPIWYTVRGMCIIFQRFETTP